MMMTDQAEPADCPNYSSRVGAEALADLIRRYWAGLGQPVAIRIEQAATRGGGVWIVKSNYETACRRRAPDLSPRARAPRTRPSPRITLLRARRPSRRPRRGSHRPELGKGCPRASGRAAIAGSGRACTHKPPLRAGRFRPKAALHDRAGGWSGRLPPPKQHGPRDDKEPRQSAVFADARMVKLTGENVTHSRHMSALKRS
jgi:hypothetical protein